METSLTETTVDPDIYELVPGFCESRKKDLQALNTHLSANDFNAIAKISHTIKGIARPYGFPTLETLIIQLEKAAKTSDRMTCTKLLTEIDTYFKSYCNS
ncbi:MAG: hypothetical protein A2622_12500 [Bdellovibrionales bacterium RIFCSPHIGHO2_01_FULL_40_29]|nr:MAG: hypothetical protein A2622_12500 [Bdellovibrionales bacterium RIFCSPHIGHO2_01_FULL_40_29]OFZ33004.1 MAG: hypothetical protein A3D17_09810 [Bdellovibrionales bacterium RIFCSPHIGHO2_02_FULL_40_15]